MRPGGWPGLLLAAACSALPGATAAPRPGPLGAALQRAAFAQVEMRDAQSSFETLGGLDACSASDPLDFARRRAALASLQRVAASAEAALQPRAPAWSRGASPVTLAQLAARMELEIESQQLGDRPARARALYRMQGDLFSTSAALLDLLEENWGHWSCEPSGELLFDEDRPAVEYNRLRTRLEGVTARIEAAARDLPPVPAAAASEPAPDTEAVPAAPDPLDP